MTPEQVNILCRLVFDTCALFLWGAHGFLLLAVAKDLAKHIEHRQARFFHLALALMVIAGIGKIAAQAALLGDGWQTVTASRHESVGSVRLLRTYGDHAARIDVSRRNGLRSTPSVGVQM